MGTSTTPTPAEDNSRDRVSDNHRPRRATCVGVVAPIPVPSFVSAVSDPMAGVRVVQVAGHLDAVTAPVLDNYLGQQLGSGRVDLVIDLDAVEFLSSCGLTVLLRCAHQLKKTNPGSTLHLTGTARPAVYRPLQLVGLLPLFNTHPLLNEALAHLRASKPAQPAPELPAPRRSDAHPT